MPEPVGSFRDMLRRTLPPWLARPYGERFSLGLLGYTGDAFNDLAILAVMSGWLSEPTSPDDAIALVAKGRLIRGYPTDTTPSVFRTRVLSAWVAWQYAGTLEGTGGEGEGLLGQFALLGYPNVEIVANWEWDAGHGDTAPDGTIGQNWGSRFWVIIPETDHNWTSDGNWGDPGTWGDGGLWGSNASFEEIDGIKKLIAQWKAGEEKCVAIIAVGDGLLWGNGATWGGGGTWGGSSIRFGF